MFKTKRTYSRWRTKPAQTGWRSQLLTRPKIKAVLLLFMLAQLGSIVVLTSGGKVYADVAPTLSDYQESNWTDVATNDVTATLTWSAGDVIVVAGISENGNATFATPTATGLSFSLVTSVNSGDVGDVYVAVWSATAGSSGSSAVTAAGQGGSAARGLAAYAYTGSQGLGNSNTMDAQNAKVISLTRANSNSAVINIMGDWDAVNDTTVNSSPAGGTVTKAVFNSGLATFFAVNWGDQGAAGTTSYGITDHTGTVDMSGAVVEVRGQATALEQEGFRWRADDGDEDGATWLANQDTNITRAADTNTRLRTLINATGDPNSNQYRLEFKKTTDSEWSTVGQTASSPEADFAIQRRCETPADGTGTVTLTAGTDYTAPANNANAFIRMVSTRLSGMGDTVGGGTQETDDFTWYISDPNFAGGSVTFTRAGTVNPQRFCWEIVEYIGDASGANEMIVRAAGTATYGSTGLTVDGSVVSGISNDADVAVFITGQDAIEAANSTAAAGLSTAEWVSASDLPRFTRGIHDNDANHISYVVVEFTGSNWAVERIEHNFSAAGSTETETITDVGSLTRAFAHAQYRSATSNLDEYGAEMWLSATNQASFLLETGASTPTDKYGVLWVVRNSDAGSGTAMNVQHLNGTRLTSATSEGAANEEDEWTETITAVDDTAQTSIMGESARSGGTGNATPRGWISLYLNSTTGVKLYHSDDGQTVNYRFQAIEWPKSPGAGPAIDLASSTNIAASGENTTAQLTAPSGKTTSDFDAGRMQDDENPADAVDITADDYTELEWSIRADSAVVADGEVYEFRVTVNGTVLDTYTATPEWTIASNTAPSAPTSAAQTKTDDTVIATGGWTNETSIELTATVTDLDAGDTVRICAEVDPVGTAFSSPAGDGDGCSASAVSTGQTATVTISGLSNGTEYHWQIKAKDADGAYSSWVSYGGNTENPPTNPADRDFGVDTSAPTGGTVYDGTETDVDKTFSDTSLSTISANWSGFDFTVSGIQKYEYSVGTTAGGTDIKNWTDNGTAASVTATGLTLQTSQLYFVNVRAYDNAGNTVTRSSSGQYVAPSLTFSVSPSSITFDALNAANSYTDDTPETTLTTSTNAYGGYVVRQAITDSPRSGSITIPDFNGGTYASPAAWGSSTGFGFSTTDEDIFPQSGSCPGGGTAPCYAPYSQTKPGDIVASHTANVSGTPITNEAVTIKHRVTVASSQSAASYLTVLLYTVTPLY